MQEQSADQTGLLVCGFSPDGSHIVAGSNDCHIYAWFWDIASAADKGKAAAKQGFYNVVSEEDAARNLAPAAAVDLEAGDWPEPQETCRLGGHVNDVLLLQFSHDGHSIATGSKDGTMRVSPPSHFPLLPPSISCAHCHGYSVSLCACEPLKPVVARNYVATLCFIALEHVCRLFSPLVHICCMHVCHACHSKLTPYIMQLNTCKAPGVGKHAHCVQCRSGSACGAAISC